MPIAAAVLVAPVMLAAFREGPLPNMAGGFGDPDCRTCHFDNPANAAGGEVDLEGVPKVYQRGRTYVIAVKIRRDGLLRGGFEIAARFASGAQKGSQAGRWEVGAGGRVQTVASKTDASLIFVQHTTLGSKASAAGTLSWSIEWTAPRSDEPVQFNLAANAANDDASPLGDFIYTREITAPAAGRVFRPDDGGNARRAARPRLTRSEAHAWSHSRTLPPP